MLSVTRAAARELSFANMMISMWTGRSRSKNRRGKSTDNFTFSHGQQSWPDTSVNQQRQTQWSTCRGGPVHIGVVEYRDSRTSEAMTG